jgi:hypothetical protein
LTFQSAYSFRCFHLAGLVACGGGGLMVFGCVVLCLLFCLLLAVAGCWLLVAGCWLLQLLLQLAALCLCPNISR